MLRKEGREESLGPRGGCQPILSYDSPLLQNLASFKTGVWGVSFKIIHEGERRRETWFKLEGPSSNPNPFILQMGKLRPSPGVGELINCRDGTEIQEA